MGKRDYDVLEESCKHISDDYNHVLEFGVASGRSIRYLRKLLNKKYKIYGFDTFTGLPEQWITKDGKVIGNVGTFSNDGHIPEVEGVDFFKGLFSDTIPLYLKIAQPIALLHVDCDLYSSAKLVLNSLIDYIKTGTIIVFDEYVYCRSKYFDDHEQKAFKEWVKEFDVEYEVVPLPKSKQNNDQCEQFAIKINKHAKQ